MGNPGHNTRAAADRILRLLRKRLGLDSTKLFPILEWILLIRVSPNFNPVQKKGERLSTRPFVQGSKWQTPRSSKLAPRRGSPQCTSCICFAVPEVHRRTWSMPSWRNECGTDHASLGFGRGQDAHWVISQCLESEENLSWMNTITTANHFAHGLGSKFRSRIQGIGVSL